MAYFLFTAILCASIAFLKSTLGADTLFPNQTIAIGQTLISQSHDFEMGFFSPGKSKDSFLGIWYKSTPDVVVWVANRNNPITHSHGVIFAISRNGTLVISGKNGSVTWSEIPSGPASDPFLQLLDTGNLVVVNQTMEGGSSESYLWQSFDYPTDTWLPGMTIMNDIEAGVETYLRSWRNWDDPTPGDFFIRIENEGLPEFAIYKGNKKMSRSGKWNGRSFNGYPGFPKEIINPEMIFRRQRLITVSLPYDSSIVTRGTLDTSGSHHRYTMNSRKDKWNHVYTFPGDQCDEYGLCGPNGICIIDKPIRCQCLKGFAPKVPKDWNLQDWSAGCTRITPLNCESGDGFQEVRGVKCPDMLTYWLNASMNLVDCKSQCLKNCNCTAYANPFITDGGTGCLMWFGDLIDTREYPGADSKQNIYIRIPVSQLVNDSTNELEKEKKKTPTRLILISIASGVLVSCFINGGLFFMTRRRRQATKENSEDVELPLFKFATIVAATNNFSKENMIGEGGFGTVYKHI